MRSAQTLTDLATAMDVAHNWAFAPKLVVLGTGPVRQTFCNDYASVMTAALGCVVPPLTANQQNAWLKSNEGKMAGWMPVDHETARQRTELGYPVLYSWLNGTGGSGHIAIGVPPPPADGGHIYVSAAGAECFVFTRIENSFGLELAAVTEAFTHD